MKKILLLLGSWTATSVLCVQSATVYFSDRFEREGSTPCTLGAADNAIGGTDLHYYIPNFPANGTDGSNPVGAVLAGGALQNAGADFGGVQFTRTPDPCGALRGSDMGQDLTISMRVRVPSDSENRVSYAGPYFRSRLSVRGDGIIGGGASDPSGGYWVQLRSNGEIRVLRLDKNEVVASTGFPLSFDSAADHSLVVSVQGNSLQIALDEHLQTFTYPAGCALVAEVPNTGIGNQGAAGIAFGTDNRGLIGGQRVDDLVVTEYMPIETFPLSHNPALLIQTTNVVNVLGSNAGGPGNLAVCDIYNLGLLQLDSIDSSWSSTVTVDAYLTNAPGGVIEILPGAGGGRTIFADIANAGTFRIDTHLALSKPGGKLQNTGEFDLSTNVNLSFDPTGQQVFNQSSGMLNFDQGSQMFGSGGTLNVAGGSVRIGPDVQWRDLTLNYTGGTLVGSPYLFNTRFAVGPAAAPAQLLIEGVANQVRGDIPQGQTIWVQGSNRGQQATLLATNGFENRGLLRIESIDSSWGSGLSLSSGTFTNASSGAMHWEAGSFGPRYLAANVLNLGKIEVNHHLTFAKPGESFANRGQFSINTNVSLTLEAGATQTVDQNAGTLSFREGSQLFGSGGGLNIIGGVVEVGADVTWRDLVIDYAGGAIVGSPYLFNSQLSIRTGAAPTLFTIESQLNQMNTDIPAGQALWVQGSNRGQQAALQSANGFENRGLLRISSVDSSWGSGLVVSGGKLTNSTAGVIEIGAGSQGPRFLQADVLNLGAISVEQHLDLTKVGGTFENRGSFDLNTNLNLNFESSGGHSFNQSAGSLKFNERSQFFGSGGSFNIQGGSVQVGRDVSWRDLAVNYRTGAIIGSPDLLNTKLTISSTAAPASFVILSQQNQLLGDIPEGQALWVQGSNRGQQATLNATNGFANKGLLRIEAIDSSWGCGIALSEGSLTNAESGFIHVAVGLQGPRYFDADVLNLGAISLEQSVDLTKIGGLFSNRGSLDLNTNVNLNFENGGSQIFAQSAGKFTLRERSQLFGSGGTLNITGGLVDLEKDVVWRNLIVNYSGGEIRGPVYVFASKLRFHPAAGPGYFIIEAEQDFVESDIPARQTLWIQGSSFGQQGTLRSINGFSNSGVLRIESVDSSWASRIQLEAGILLNKAGGLIEINRGSGGPRAIAGELSNQGALAVNYDLTLEGSVQSNAGLVTIAPGATLDVLGSYTQVAGQTVLNEGVIRSDHPIVIGSGLLAGKGRVQGNVDNSGIIAPDGGNLEIRGSLSQKTAGAIAFKTGVSSLSDMDGLIVDGVLTLGGTLRLELDPAYAPGFGDKLTLIRASAISGTFTSLALPPLTNNLAWSVQYGDTSVAVQVVRTPGSAALDEARVTAGSTFEFSFSGLLNTGYAIESSADLVAWIPLTNFVQSAAAMHFTLPGGTNIYQFYRAVSR